MAMPNRRRESWNELSPKSYAPPIPEDEVLVIMQRAEAAVGHACHLWPCMRDLQRTREDGWSNLGSIAYKETWQSYDVWWNRERRQGWLWALVMRIVMRAGDLPGWRTLGRHEDRGTTRPCA